MVIKLPKFTKTPPKKEPVEPTPVLPPEPPKPTLRTTDIVDKIKKDNRMDFDIGKDDELDTPDESEEELIIPDDFGEDELISSLVRQFRDDIIELRNKMAVTPVKTEFINLTEAGQLCTFGITGNDFHFCLMKQEERDKAAAPSWLEDHKETLMVFAIIFAFIVIGTVIIYNVMGR